MPSQPPHSHPTSIPIPGGWRMGSANRPHRLLLGVLSSTFPAPPSPPQRREDGICCSPSFLLRHLAMLPWDQHFAPRFPLSFPAGFPVFSLSLWQDPAFSLPSHPKSSWKTPGRAPTFRLHPDIPASPQTGCTPRPSLQGSGASVSKPPCLAQPPPPSPPGNGNSRGGIPGSRSRSSSSYLPAPCAAPGAGVAQVKALPFPYLTFPVRLE